MHTHRSHQLGCLQSISHSARAIGARFALGMLALILVGAGCRKSHEEAEFDACYKRCIDPPAKECQPGHPWCVVACRGGARQSPIVSARVGGAAGKDDGPAILAHSVGLETIGGVYTPLIRKCSDLPTEFSEAFSTGADNQSSVEIVLLTGEAPVAKDNQLLGRFHLDGIRPAPRGVPQIDVRFRIDRGGSLEVTATDRDTKQRQGISVAIEH